MASDDKHLHIPPELHDLVKSYCKQRGLFVQNFVIEAIKAAMVRPKRRFLDELPLNKRVPDPMSAPPFWSRVEPTASCSDMQRDVEPVDTTDVPPRPPRGPGCDGCP